MAERDDKGRFIAGNKASPGRPPRTTEREYLDALIAEVPLDKWQKVVRKAVTDATEGSGYARQWLSEYLIGKPPTILELRAADAALLRELIKVCEQQGVGLSELLQAMIAEMKAVGEES